MAKSIRAGDPLQLVEIVKGVLKGRHCNEAKNKILAVQRRLLDPKHRILVVGTPTILVALLLLHPTDAILGCLMYLTTGLIWFLPTSNCLRSA